MITEAQIQSAINAGILDEATANALKAHASGAAASTHADEEHFRLVTGFNDIFVVIASILLLISVTWIGNKAGIGSFLAAATAWGLSEFFVLKRRMALPAIVLLIAFVGNVFAACTGVAAAAMNTGYYSVFGYMPSNLIIVPALVAAFAAWLHWRRFKVPITVAAGSAALAGAALASLYAAFPIKELLFPAIMLAGLAVFGFAMRWDASDTSRQTRKSDVGFWLHLLAAPLIIHPVFNLIGVLNGHVNMLQGAVVFALYIALGLVSLLIDRRALMVSALGYVVYVFTELLRTAGNIELGFAITAFVIGSALLLLSAFWHRCRAFLLTFLPANLLKFLPAAKLNIS